METSYDAVVTVTDSKGFAVTRQIAIGIDTKAPGVTGPAFAATVTPFSPNSDGTKDTTGFSGAFTETSSYTITIRNAQGSVVRTLSGAAGGGPGATTWNGKNGSGVTVPDGTYTAYLTITDLACNVSTDVASATIVVDTVGPTISSLQASNPKFCGGSLLDCSKPTTTITATLADPAPPLTWTVDIDGGARTSPTGSGTSVSWTWDGYNSQSQAMSEGGHTATVTATDLAGNRRTLGIGVDLDYTPPTITNPAVTNPIFSPDGDGSKDTARFTATLADSASTPVETTVKVKQGANPIRTSTVQSGANLSWDWDGRNNANNPAGEGSYTATIEAVDQAGLKTTSGNLSVTIDLTPPTISGYTESFPNFSPNGDGTKDTTTFTATLSDASTPIGWTLEMKQGSTTVRTYTGTGNPNQSWDGRNGSNVLQGDGSYQAVLTARDEAGVPSSSTRTVVLDTTVPSIAGFAVSEAAFSPNADGTEDSSAVTASIADTLSAPAGWLVRVKNQSGSTVRTSTTSTSTSAAFTWDGKNDGGTVQPEGSYTVELEATDTSGMRATSSGTIVLDLTAPAIAGSTVAPTPFSPNGDGTKETTTVSATLSDARSEPVTTTVKVKTGAGATIRTSTPATDGNLAWTWDGRNGSGALVGDGVYTSSIEAVDAAGMKATADLSVTLDTTAPFITNFAVSNPNFSPDGDGTKDTTTVSATLSDSASPPVSYTLRIRQGVNPPVRTYTGTGSSLSQAWDGKNAAGTVQPDGTYTAELTASDAAGVSVVDTLEMVLDRVGPTISNLAASEPRISPNADGTKDTTMITATVADDLSAPVTSTVRIKNGAGTTIRISPSTSSSSLSFDWDGKNDAGTVQPDGTYSAYVEATDAAGVKAISVGVEVILDLTPPAITGQSVSEPYISPNADGTKDTTTIQASIDETGSPPATTIIRVKNSGGTTIRTSPTSTSSAISWIWDGRDGGGAVVPDAAYTATISATDEVGLTSTADLTIRIDATAPSITGLGVTNTHFSPNGDGIKDTTTANAQLVDTSPLSWVVNFGSSDLRSYSGSGSTVSQSWDGRNSSNFLVPEDKYFVQVIATDAAGMSASTNYWGVRVDLTAPTISGLSLSEPIISPNDDGTKDTSRITGTLADVSTPLTWTVKVKNGSGAAVRTATGTGGSLDYTWDGKNGSNITQPDGTYTIEVQVNDAAAVTRLDTSLTVRIDASGPTISSLVASNPIFSPNADGTLDTTTVTASLSDVTQPIAWTIELRSGSLTHRVLSGTGDAVSAVWDGQDGSGSVVADGAYDVHLTATDDVGASRVDSSLQLTIDTTPPTIANLSASNPAFSPNSDGVLDTTSLSASIADASASTWTLVIADGTGASVFTRSGSTTSVAADWDGRNTASELLKDGDYTATVVATDLQGLTDTSIAAMAIDTRRQILDWFGATPDPFTPDGDGVDDVAIFSADPSEELHPGWWALEIRSTQNSERVWSASGTGEFEGVRWDGRSGAGSLVPEGLYVASITGSDAAGNADTQVTYVRVAASIQCLFVPESCSQSTQFRYSPSYYVSIGWDSEAQLQQAGCDLAQQQIVGTAPPDMVVILEFFAPVLKDGAFGVSVLSGDPSRWKTLAEVEQFVQSFAESYWACAMSVWLGGYELDVVVGTNNSGQRAREDNVFMYEHGAAFARMVRGINAALDGLNNGPGFFPKVRVHGGIDAESNPTEGFGPPLPVVGGPYIGEEGWKTGYEEEVVFVYSRGYTNFGSLDGCPPYGSCINGWSQDWYGRLSFNGTGHAFPQVYNDKMADQWHDLCLTRGGCRFTGAVSEEVAREQRGGPRWGPDNAWHALYSRVQCDSRLPKLEGNVRHSTDFRWELYNKNVPRGGLARSCD